MRTCIVRCVVTVFGIVKAFIYLFTTGNCWRPGDLATELETGSGSGHGPPVTVQTEKFCTFFAREVKMKCPKSEEFFGVNT
jgi:hypothetical protein